MLQVVPDTQMGVKKSFFIQRTSDTLRLFFDPLLVVSAQLLTGVSQRTPDLVECGTYMMNYLTD